MQETLPAFNIDEIEKRMLNLPQADCPVSHHFGPGLYIRELRMKAGTLAVGHRQKLPHVNSFIQGRVLVLNPDGTQTELIAPCTFVGQPGRKIGFVLEDVIWQNIYATDETDIETLEETYLDKTEYSKEIYKKKADYESDHIDYKLLIEQSGISPEQVDSEVHNIEDQIPMPFGWHKTCVRTSDLHGKGFFASAPFEVGEVIAPAKIGEKRTPAGRFTNHSHNPNAELFPVGDDIILIALRDISGCKAGDNGEEITIDYRQSLRLRGIQLNEDELCQE